MMAFEDFLEQMRAVAPTLWGTLLAFEYLPSTNGKARELLRALPAEAYPSGRFALTAFEQTAGRGRQGRGWLSPPGGLYCSWIVPLDDKKSLRTLPLIAAVALCRGLRAFGVPQCGVKWPNDLVVGKRKIAGILIEVVTPHPQRGPAAIIGCGVNANQEVAELAEVGATTLAVETGEPVDLGALLVRLTRELEGALEKPADTARIAEDYEELLVHRIGDSLTWTQQGERLEGTFGGIDPRGGLRLRTAAGERIVNAGELIEE